MESIMEPPNPVTENEDLLREASDPGFFADFWDFLQTSRKWWMLPRLAGPARASHQAKKAPPRCGPAGPKFGRKAGIGVRAAGR